MPGKLNDEFFRTKEESFFEKKHRKMGSFVAGDLSNTV